MGNKLKMVIFVAVCSLFFMAFIYVEFKDSLGCEGKNSTVSSEETDESSEELKLSDAEITDIVSTEDVIIIDKELDDTYVTLAMMTPETWSMALGISLEDGSISGNSTIESSNNFVNVENHTQGTNASQLINSAGKNNALFTIYQIENNTDEKINLSKFMIGENIYSIPVSVNDFELTLSNELGGLSQNSQDFYINSQAFCKPEFKYSSDASYINVQISGETNMIEAICYDYPHYENDDSYFECYVAGIGIGLKQSKVEEYFGEGTALCDYSVCYKNDSGIVVVEYEHENTDSDLSEEEIAAIVGDLEEDVQIQDVHDDPLVVRVYMFEAVKNMESEDNNIKETDINTELTEG